MNDLRQKCRSCERTLKLSQFSLNPRMPGGFQRVCKQCRKRQQTDRFYKKSEIAELMLKWGRT